MRVLVTGAAGFAGRHSTAELIGAGHTVVALHREPEGDEAAIVADLLHASETQAAVAAAAPDAVLHLAALASVGRSWQEPAATLHENLTAASHLLDAVRAEAPNARVLLAGSGEVYGAPDALPVAEDATVRPQNPYAVSKACVELLGGFHADAHGVHVIRTRAFNHAGPGQVEEYALGSFARQLAEARLAGAATARIVTGTPDARRDFTDVRDVARAYRLLLEDADAGIYNICSGKSRSIRELVALMGEATGTPVEHVVDPARVRPIDVPEIVGSCARLTAATGWRPEIPIERTLADAVAAWESALRAA